MKYSKFNFKVGFYMLIWKKSMKLHLILLSRNLLFSKIKYSTTVLLASIITVLIIFKFFSAIYGRILNRKWNCIIHYTTRTNITGLVLVNFVNKTLVTVTTVLIQLQLYYIQLCGYKLYEYINKSSQETERNSNSYFIKPHCEDWYQGYFA